MGSVRSTGQAESRCSRTVTCVAKRQSLVRGLTSKSTSFTLEVIDNKWINKTFISDSVESFSKRFVLLHKLLYSSYRSNHTFHEGRFRLPNRRVKNGGAGENRSHE